MDRTPPWIALALALALAPGLGAGELRFARVDRAWGLDFRHHHGGSGRYYMVETNGGGVVLFDYDGDGDVDVFLVDGAALPGWQGRDSGEAPRSRLFRNDGGSFADVTRAAGIDLDVYGSGGAAGDIDSDGDVDLYVTAFGRNRLLSNNGDGTFSEIGHQAGVDDPLWGSSAAFADVDRDGDLDLYVANYVDFSLENNIVCGDQRRRLRGYCGPDVYASLPDRFFKNRGDGTFVDATREAGFGGARGAGLALSFADLDDDGWPDLYVANDLTPNFFFHNRGDGTFEEIALLAGTAYGHRGHPEAGMGVAVGDYDGDQRLDVAVTNYEGEPHALYGNLGDTVFNDRRFVSGLAEPTLRLLAFGIVAADLDHDGDLDLVSVNGHVRDNAAEFNASSRYRQPNQVFANRGDGRFEEIADPFSYVGASRGLAGGDLDGDGDLDLVITNVNDEVEVYENTGTDGAWLQVDLRASRGNRYGIGARLGLETGAKHQLREVTAGSSYMSQNALTVHFGLGPKPGPHRLRVRWSDGRVQVIGDLLPSRRLRLTLPGGGSGIE